MKTLSPLTTGRLLSVSFALLVLSGCAARGSRRIDVGGYRLWVQVAGHGAPTVVFENGGGNDSSVWTTVEPAIRRLGVRTVLYDRAGLGKSEPMTGPYRVDDEVGALVRVLDALEERGPIIVVAHSYGGILATLLSKRDSRVQALVLLDAPLANFASEVQVAGMMARHAKDLEAITQAQPALARVLRAYPETAGRLREVAAAPTLPIIDIVAERPQVDSAEEAAAWRQAHLSFVAASPAREHVLAEGSGHFVMTDRPDIVIDAVSRMVQRIQTR